MIRLQAHPFDPGGETNAFIARVGQGGAVVAFTGLVRSTPDAPIKAMTLEHYPALAKNQLERLRQDAIDRFDLLDAVIVHRFGTLYPGEPIVQAMAAALHRGPAFEGASFMMDTLKTSAPFWKKEHHENGDRWVEAKTSDDRAVARWQKEKPGI